MCSETGDHSEGASAARLNSSSRRDFRRRAHALSPSVLIGRRGVTDAIVVQVRQLFEKTDLIKARVQSDAKDDVVHAADELSRRVPCLRVGRTGRTFTLARMTEKDT